MGKSSNDVFLEVDATFRLDLKQLIEAMPTARLLGVRVIGFDRSGGSRVELEIQRSHTFDGRSVQAGVIGALADFAGVSASAAALGDGWMASTTGFEVHNLAPANGERLVAIGKALLAKRSQGVSVVEVFSVSSTGERTVVAHATTMCRPFQLAPS
jgi:acyl-coenzyme A thioesterase PaaI-like protein